MRTPFEWEPGEEPRFVEGTLPELEELFGSPIPEVPVGHLRPGEHEAPLVELHPELRRAFREFVKSAYQRLAGRRSSDAAVAAVSDWEGRSDSTVKGFEEALVAVLINILERERRLGLLNLFWLAHAIDAAEILHQFFSEPGISAPVKYQMHPLLQGAYRNARGKAWTWFKSQRGDKLRYNLGVRFNARLIDCIIEDQLPLTEVSLTRLNLSQVLIEQNKRFRLSFREFKEIAGALRERLREGLQRKEARLLDVLRRAFPRLRPEQYDEEKSSVKVLFNTRVFNFLLADLDGLGGKLLANRTLRAEVGRGRGWSELLADYVDVVQAVKRSEVVELMRRGIVVAGPEQTEAERRQRYDEGRLYRFSPEGEVLNLARKITILFADLREFTRTSEGAVSERELTQHLYEVFDPLASIVEQYQGRIDKFTGDGVMITFGSTRLTPQDERNALRTALALQGMMQLLRSAGRTHFRMGISVHTGRAQVAHFILDDLTMDRTVIGRNVNIAGRLSGSSRTHTSALGEQAWLSAGRPRSTPSGENERDVWVDQEGALYNVGIVVSQDTVEELVKVVPCHPLAGASGGGHRFFDEVLGRNVLLEYVGDARLKDIGRSLAIYRLGLEDTPPSGSEQRPRERQ